MSSRISKIARKSVVIVADKDDSDAYCSGCVMIKDTTVRVIAPLGFVKGRERRLKVVFFDKTEFDAELVAVRDSFCSLRTVFHSGCETISLLEDEHLVGPECTFMFVPQSRMTNQKMSTYATVESLESYLNVETVQRVNSTNYFMVSCPYFGKTLSGINRLSAAPVFTMLGKTMGIVLQDCRPEAPGAEMKVALKATYLRELMMSLDPPAPSRNLRKKRKRKCH